MAVSLVKKPKIGKRLVAAGKISPTGNRVSISPEVFDNSTRGWITFADIHLVK